MKKTFQWLSAMALIVMGACMSVACSSDSDGGGGTPPDNSKLVGTWVIKSISPDDGHGPSVGDEMTFNANGTFSQGRDQGTYTYDSSSGTFTAKMNSMTMSGSFTMSKDGNTCSGTVTVSDTQGHKETFRMTLGKKGTEPEPEEAVIDERMVGEWTIMTDEGDDAAEGKTITFNANGIWAIANYQSGTCTTETQEDGRIKFWLYDGDSDPIIAGKLVVVNDGNVLNGEYEAIAQKKANTRTPAKFGIVLKKPAYTYPSASNSIKGRWKMTECSMEGAPVGDILVFGDNGEMYGEGDPHINSYSITYTVVKGVMTCEIEMSFDNGPTISGTIPLSGNTVTLTGTATMDDESMPITATLVRQ